MKTPPNNEMALPALSYRDVVIPKEVIREIETHYLNSTAVLLAEKDRLEGPKSTIQIIRWRC
jgi:hypothetical protein